MCLPAYISPDEGQLRSGHGRETLDNISPSLLFGVGSLSCLPPGDLGMQSCWRQHHLPSRRAVPVAVFGVFPSVVSVILAGHPPPGATPAQMSSQALPVALCQTVLGKAAPWIKPRSGPSFSHSRNCRECDPCRPPSRTECGGALTGRISAGVKRDGRRPAGVRLGPCTCC